MCARKLARSARDQKEGLSIEAPADGDFRCPSLPSRGFGCLDREQYRNPTPILLARIGCKLIFEVEIVVAAMHLRQSAVYDRHLKGSARTISWNGFFVAPVQTATHSRQPCPRAVRLIPLALKSVPGHQRKCHAPRLCDRLADRMASLVVILKRLHH